MNQGLVKACWDLPVQAARKERGRRWHRSSSERQRERDIYISIERERDRDREIER